MNLESGLGTLVLEPTSEIQYWTGLCYETRLCNSGVSGINKYGGNTYERFGDWKQIKLAYEDETSLLQEWAFIYDSHGNFFIRNRQSGDYVRNGSTVGTPYNGSTSYKYETLNITTELFRGSIGYPDKMVAYTGNWEIPIITTPIFNETDAYRYSLVNIDSHAIRNPFYNTEYYKYLRYSDTSLPFEEPKLNDYYKNQDYSAYQGTIKDIKTTISKGISNYQLSDIDGDIVHLYPEWIKE